MAGSGRSSLSTKRLETALVLVLIAAAFALRLVQLGADSLWYDETVSTFLAGQPVAELVAHTARDIHPPGYYLLLKGWLSLSGYPAGQAGASGFGLEFMAAFLSTGFGVLLVPLAWQLARGLALPRPAPILAALLAALSPFGVWYSQEVRMYTLGASLGVICLLATIPFLGQDRPVAVCRRAAVVYAGAAAAGLYTLYYFAFLLVALNALVLPLMFYRRTRAGLGLWLAAQAGALLLFLPWLPVAVRQATNPPVPPWRSLPPLSQVVVESWTALSFGQSATPLAFGLLLLLTLGLVASAVVWAIRGDWLAFAADPGLRSSLGSSASHASSLAPSRGLAVGLLLTAAFGPLLLIYLVSLITPLYHVRYLFIYSPAFSVLLALGLAVLGRWRWPLGRWLMAGAALLLVLGSAVSLRALWTDPVLAADDHRSAVREMAERWRPGEAILVNAGYAYPALLTYWPLPVAWHGRLTEFEPAMLSRAAADQAAVILQTGHVDGAANLGWGDPRSDFYAVSSDEIRQQMAALAEAGARLWHYRIYDTVNDPQGVIRGELDSGWRLFDDRVYAGEANLRVQGFQPPRQPSASMLSAEYAKRLTLQVPSGAVPDAVVSGSTLDVPGVTWTLHQDGAEQPLAISLRLVDERGDVWVAHDELLGGNTGPAPDGLPLLQPLHFDVPAGTPPGVYRLELVVYEVSSGNTLEATAGPLAAGTQAILGEVEVQRPVPAPTASDYLADFGPVHLVEASSPATSVSPGDQVPVALLWQAAPAAGSESLIVVVQLLDEDGRVVASLEEEPLQGRYPTLAWQPGELVADRHSLGLPAGLAAGRYWLIAGLYRATDRNRLTTAAGRDYAVIQEIEVR